MRQIVAGLGFVALTGCSFALVRGPAANHQQLPVVECTTSKLGPILDIIWTGLQATNIVGAAILSDAEWDEQFSPNDAPFSRKAAMGMYAGFAALGAAGMYYGFSRTARCRDAKAEWMIRAQQGGGAVPPPGQPGTWPPPQQGSGSGPAQGPGTWPPPAQSPPTKSPPAQSPPAQTPPVQTPPAQPGTWPPPLPPGPTTPTAPPTTSDPSETR